ncbi:MAG: hypothetical protein IIB61_05090 [Planctomycetes bacterium]|nr:hypothetical protein [Planctomycetota bacterium]
MDDRKRQADELILDWHLDRIDPDDREWLERELLRDAGLRARSDRLATILHPLDHWAPPQAPGGLAERILRNITGTRGSQPDVFSLPPIGAANGAPTRSFSYRDLIAVAACILFVVTVVLPGVSGLRRRSQRQLCASQLGSIYQGVQTYRTTFAGALPFAGNAGGSSWLPGTSGDSVFASNSRHVNLVVRYRFVPNAKLFVCPSDPQGKPADLDDPTAHDDFPGVGRGSYASLNLSGTDPHLRSAATVAYMSDANPLFEGGKFNADVDPYTTNSRAHGGAGQCVQFLDGHSEWQSTPVTGQGRDNLWLAGSLMTYTGTESRDNDNDAFLVQGFAARPSDTH